MSRKNLQKYKRAARLFQKVQPRLLLRHRGDIVAVDPDSGRYFIGEDELEVARRAVAALPGKIFGFFRVGYPAVHKFRLFRACA